MDNGFKKTNKRKSDINIQDFSAAKRYSNHNEENIFNYSRENSKTIVSSCLTEKLKVKCVLENKSEKRNINILDERTNHLSHTKVKKIDDDIDNNPVFGSTPEESNSSDLKPCFNIDDILILSNSKPSNSTPKKKILSLEEFRKLPKPKISLISNEINDSFIMSPNVSQSIIMEQSINDSNTSLMGDEFLNGSFGYMKNNLSKPRNSANLCFNSSFLTPETPCDINEFTLHNVEVPKLEPMQNFSSLLQNRKCYNEVSNESPIFYDVTSTSRKSNCRVKPINKIQGVCEEINVCSKIEPLSTEEVVKIIENDFTSDSHAYQIIDCRFPYEYEAGHIYSAVNLYTPWQLLNYIFLSNYDVKSLRTTLENPEKSLEELLQDIKKIKKPKSIWKFQAFIFHCEFSSIRGPEMARLLRDIDIIANISCYPNLFFPKVYIMKKGYNEFYGKFKHWCQPCNYLRMDLDDNEDVLVKNDIDEHSRKGLISQYNFFRKELQDQILITGHLIRKLNVLEDGNLDC